MGLWENIINQIRSIFKPGMVVCDAETDERNSKKEKKKEMKKEMKKESKGTTVVKKDDTPVENA